MKEENKVFCLALVGVSAVFALILIVDHFRYEAVERELEVIEAETEKAFQDALKPLDDHLRSLK